VERRLHWRDVMSRLAALIVATHALAACETSARSLADTGLYADLGAGTLAPDVTPYRPQFELWSDGAAKERWLHLPPGTQIDSSDMDAWVYPVGTKLWKQFSRDGVRVETRMLEKLAPGEWDMVAFAWTDDGLDARSVPEGRRDAGGTGHDIPGEDDCAG
jgi:hypothetical protein